MKHDKGNNIKNRYFKRTAAGLLTAMLVMSLCACSSDTAGNTADTAEQVQSEADSNTDQITENTDSASEEAADESDAGKNGSDVKNDNDAEFYSENGLQINTASSVSGITINAGGSFQMVPKDINDENNLITKAGSCNASRNGLYEVVSS